MRKKELSQLVKEAADSIADINAHDPRATGYEIRAKKWAAKALYELSIKLYPGNTEAERALTELERNWYGYPPGYKPTYGKK
jgi:hypothetical protein